MVELVLQGRSLVFLDPRSKTTLAHWALDALVRRKSAPDIVVLSPSAQDDESLELTLGVTANKLTEMIDLMTASRPKPGRLRGFVVTVATLGIVGLALIVGPSVLISHTASVVPSMVRRDIGALALADLTRLTGSTCTSEVGQAAVQTFMSRLFAAQGANLVVVRTGVDRIRTLPGPLFVVERAMLESSIGPEALAGYLLAEFAKAQVQDPLVLLLRYVGVVPSFKLLTTSNLPQKALTGYGEAFLRQKEPDVADVVVLPLFSAANISTAAYVKSQKSLGKSELYLSAHDPYARGSELSIMTDGEWISLQDICTD